jgi:hypothetical protein
MCALQACLILKTKGTLFCDNLEKVHARFWVLTAPSSTNRLRTQNGAPCTNSVISGDTKQTVWTLNNQIASRRKRIRIQDQTVDRSEQSREPSLFGDSFLLRKLFGDSEQVRSRSCTRTNTLLISAVGREPRRAVWLADSDAWRHTLATEGSHWNFTRGIQEASVPSRRSNMGVSNNLA